MGKITELLGLRGQFVNKGKPERCLEESYGLNAHLSQSCVRNLASMTTAVVGRGSGTQSGALKLCTSASRSRKTLSVCKPLSLCLVSLVFIFLCVHGVCSLVHMYTHGG